MKGDSRFAAAVGDKGGMEALVGSMKRFPKLAALQRDVLRFLSVYASTGEEARSHKCCVADCVIMRGPRARFSMHQTAPRLALATRV